MIVTVENWYLAQQNLWVQGQPLLWGHEYQLDPTPEVALLVTNGALIAQAGDGTYPVPTARAYGAGACCRNMSGG